MSRNADFRLTVKTKTKDQVFLKTKHKEYKQLLK